MVENDLKIKNFDRKNCRFLAILDKAFLAQNDLVKYTKGFLAVLAQDFRAERFFAED